MRSAVVIVFGDREVCALFVFYVILNFKLKFLSIGCMCGQQLEWAVYASAYNAETDLLLLSIP